MNKKTNSGYSIIELLVALAMIAILLTISISVGRGAVHRANFTSVLNGFMADFNYARQLATRLNRYVAIDFDDQGRSYQILVQRNIGDYVNFDVDRTVEPLGGDEFLASSTDFIVNSMGLIRAYPVVANSPPIQVVLEFIQKNKANTSTVYKTDVTIFPSGGIKIEE